MFWGPAETDEGKREQIEALYARSRRQFPEVPEITVEELERLREEREVVLVDVRKPQEQAVSMIPGAIPAERFEQEVERHRDATVVAYCTIGHRSGLFARALRQRGLEALNLKGAILSWTHSGGELRDGDGPTRRVHVGGPRWALQAEGYEPVW